MTLDKAFWRGAADRAIRTFIQAAIATIAATGITGLHEVDWLTVLSIAGLSALVSLGTSIATPKTVSVEAGRRVDES